MPSNNVQLEYSQIVTVSTQLQGSVDNLLNDGLFLQHTSPAMRDAYFNFTTQLTQIVNKIEDFAKQFESIKTQIDDMDRTMAAQIGGNQK